MKAFFNARAYDTGSKGTPTRIPQCGKCGLVKKCLTPRMETFGSGKRRVLFVGEAPGEQEDRIGRPFIGPSGELLNQALRRLGTSLDECSVTNAIICRPPKNKIESTMVTCCRPNLLKTIKVIKPHVIVTLGMSALTSLLQGLWKKDIKTMERWAGWTIPLSSFHAWLCPTYHPAYILRQERDPTVPLMFQKHLAKALSLENLRPRFLTLDSLYDQIDIIQNLHQAMAKLTDLCKAEGLLAFDYETTGLKPEREKHAIVTVSFCLNGEDTFAIPLHSRLHGLLKAILMSERLRKVAGNMKFEERWTRAKLGCEVAGWHWDTMLAAHLLDNRSDITSVKFQSFALLGVPSYDDHIEPYLKAKTANSFNRIRELDMKDLLLYNGMDSLLEFMLMKKQKEQMGATQWVL